MGITIRFRDRTSGQAGRVKQDGRTRYFDTVEEAEAYCREHSTQMRSLWVETDEDS